MNARKQGVAEAGAPCRAVVVLHMNRHLSVRTVPNLNLHAGLRARFP